MTDHELRDDPELHSALAAVAGPAAPASPADRAAVRTRVRRARRRVAATSVTGVLVAVLASAGLVAAVTGDADSGPAAQPSPRICPRVPEAVPAASVPDEVSRWASGRPVVGGGSLWTARSVLRQRPGRVDGAWRIKLGWYVRPPGPDATPPTLTARRVDGPGRATGGVSAATDHTGTWFASTISFPTAGCWQVTARHGDDTIRFRTLAGPVPAAPAGSSSFSAR